MTLKSILRSGIALGALALGEAAFAQAVETTQEAQEASAPPASQDVIIVTGTNIQGARVNEALPVTIVTQDDLAAIGGVDVHKRRHAYGRAIRRLNRERYH